jgi:hypothetical protein
MPTDWVVPDSCWTQAILTEPQLGLTSIMGRAVPPNGLTVKARTRHIARIKFKYLFLTKFCVFNKKNIFNIIKFELNSMISL